MNTDPIADFLTALEMQVLQVIALSRVPASNIKKEITKILFDQGFILSYKFEEGAILKEQLK